MIKIGRYTGASCVAKRTLNFSKSTNEPDLAYDADDESCANRANPACSKKGKKVKSEKRMFLIRTKALIISDNFRTCFNFRTKLY